MIKDGSQMQMVTQTATEVHRKKILVEGGPQLVLRTWESYSRMAATLLVGA